MVDTKIRGTCEAELKGHYKGSVDIVYNGKISGTVHYANVKALLDGSINGPIKGELDARLDGQAIGSIDVTVEE